MLIEKDKDILKKFRETVKSEISRLKLNAPKFSVHCDYKTKKLKLNYSFSKYNGSDKKNNNIYIKKQKDFYLKGISLINRNVFIEELPYYINLLNEKIVDESKKSELQQNNSLIHWAKIYTQSPKRINRRKLKKSTLKADKDSLDLIIKYCSRQNKMMLDIWQWPKKGSSFLVQFMDYKRSGGDNKKPWSKGTINSHYQRIRAYFNWLSHNVELFPSNIFGRLSFEKSKKNLLFLNKKDFSKIENFIASKISSEKWSWFIKMLSIMMETGLKTEELCKIELKNISIKKKTFDVYTLNKKRIKYQISDRNWELIYSLIYNKNNILRNDKKYLFHSKFYRKNRNKNIEKMVLIENKNKSFSGNGFRKKFHEMLIYLKLSKKYTPAVFRHGFILNMLNRMNGDFAAVSEKIGLSKESLIRKYLDHVNISPMNTLINKAEGPNFDDKKTKTKRLKGGGVSVPFMITREMFRELITLGYTKEQISQLKSEEAHDILISS